MPTRSSEKMAHLSDFHYEQEQIKTYIRHILDVCEEEKERDEGKFKSVCTNVLDKLWDSFCPLVGVDEEKDEDENDEIMNDGMNEDENTKEKNKIKKCNDSIGENTKEEELRNTLYSKILDEVLQDANLNTSEKTRKDLKQNNQTSYYSEEFEKPNFTLEDSHDLLISWLVQEWEHRFKYSVEDSAKEHAERHFARIEYLIDRIKRKEGGGKELDDGKENKGRITKEKDDRKNNERDVAEKEEYKEEDQEEGEEEEEEEDERNEEEDGDEVGKGAKESKFLEFRKHSQAQTQKIFQNSIYEAHWAKTRSTEVKPEDFLESGKDPAFTKLFRKQGAMVLKLHDSGWDENTNASTLLNLDWIRNTRVQLQTLSPDYQYIRQTLPDPETGILRKYQDMDGYDPSRAEFGALVEEIQENFKFAAQPLRLMGVVERERFFITQIQNKLQAQYPYLQGVAVVAIEGGEKKALSGLPSQNPWNIFDFAERPTSITRQLLKICEAACSPHAIRIVEEKLASENKVKKKRFKRRHEDEKNKTGAKAVESDPEARTRRNERKRLLSGEGKRKGWKSGGGSKKVSTGSVSAPMVGKSPPNSSKENQMNDSMKVEFDHMQEKFFEASCEASKRKKWGAGIVNPWLYYMSPFSFFPMHFEDYALGSANVIVADPSTQCWVVWYSIPSEQIALLHEFLKDTLKTKYRIDCLESREVWINPEIIAKWNAKRLGNNRKLKVYRHVQGPGEYVITDYGSVHWGVNLGVGWKAAVNFAFLDWRDAAEKVDLEYRRIESREYPTKRHYRCAPNFGLHNEKLFSVENMLGKDKGFLNKSQKENEEHQEQEGREGREQSV